MTIRSPGLAVTEWHNTQDEEYLQLVAQRAKRERLVWCEQLIDLLEQMNIRSPSQRFSLNDYGCQYFQVYKELASRPGLTVDYFGYDIERQYLDIGLELFPELQKSFKVVDIAEGEAIRVADVSVISATLEHIGDFRSVIDVLAKKSREVVVIRSFFGSEYRKDLARKSSAEAPYLIQQFVLEDLLYPAFADWDVQVVRDRYSDSLPIVKFLNDGPIVRTAYFVVLRRNLASISESSSAELPL